MNEKKRRREFEDLSVFSELPTKKVGRPLTLGEDLYKEVQAYLLNLHEVGGVVSGAIAKASARGIIRMKNSKLLVSMEVILFLRKIGVDICYKGWGL